MSNNVLNQPPLPTDMPQPSLQFGTGREAHVSPELLVDGDSLMFKEASGTFMVFDGCAIRSEAPPQHAEEGLALVPHPTNPAAETSLSLVFL